MPEVNSIEQIQTKSSNLANLALNAIASAKAKQAATVSAMDTPPDSLEQGSPRRRRLASSESKNQEMQPSADKNRLGAQHSKIQTTTTSVASDTPLSPSKRTLPGTPQGGSFVVHGSAYLPTEGRHMHRTGLQPTPGVNVINFNNCNVTIINNTFDGSQPGQFAQSSTQAKSLSSKPAIKKQTPAA